MSSYNVLDGEDGDCLSCYGIPEGGPCVNCGALPPTDQDDDRIQEMATRQTVAILQEIGIMWQSDWLKVDILFAQFSEPGASYRRLEEILSELHGSKWNFSHANIGKAIKGMLENRQELARIMGALKNASTCQRTRRSDEKAQHKQEVNDLAHHIMNTKEM